VIYPMLRFPLAFTWHFTMGQAHTWRTFPNRGPRNFGNAPLSRALHYTYTNHYLNKFKTFDTATIDLWIFKLRQGSWNVWPLWKGIKCSRIVLVYNLWSVASRDMPPGAFCLHYQPCSNDSLREAEWFSNTNK
jgi:hypothetical protein